MLPHLPDGYERMERSGRGVSVKAGTPPKNVRRHQQTERRCAPKPPNAGEKLNERGRGHHLDHNFPGE